MRTSFGIRTTNDRRRRGSIILEFILVLPVLVVLFVASVQFGHLLLVQQAVSHAAIKAAREAGKGATLSEIVTVVDDVLTTRNIMIGANATVVLEDPMASPAVQKSGTPDCDPPATPTLSSGDVRVTVCVDITSLPLGNMLSQFGFDLSGRCFTSSAYVRQE